MSRIRLADTSTHDDVVHLVGALYRSALAEDVKLRMPDASSIELLRNGSLRFERKPGRFGRTPQENEAMSTKVLDRLNEMGIFD